ncbi:MAG: hypothetical protein AB1602_05210 [Elusimicrobiota bacterium]
MKKIVFLFVLFCFALESKGSECERAKLSDPCYGECGSFVDENSNGICDVWEKYNKKRKSLNEKTPKKVLSLGKTESKVLISSPIKTDLESNKNDTIESSDLKKEEIKNKKYEKFFKYGIFYVFTLNLVLIILSEMFSGSFYPFVRLFWNWVLMTSCFICAISGFFMYFEILTEFKKNFFALHMQTAVISSVTGFYHTYKRFKCMIKIK